MAVINVIKYDGSPNVLAWKHPCSELGTWTQLIVNESQEAVLYKSGKALDVFASGRYTLDTANIPLLSKIINIPFGGRSPFTAEVWYVNKAVAMDIKWGTQTPIQLQDPKYQVFVPVRAHGQFGIQIENTKQFLVKLVGTLPIFDQANVQRYFRGVYLTKVKDAISSYLVHKQVGILEINAYLEDLSDHMQTKMQPVFADFGIKLVNFNVTDISVPEDDPAVQELKSALASKARMNIIGYTYQQERSFDTVQGIGQNVGGGASGAMVDVGVGLGVGMGVGRVVGGMMNEIATNVSPTQSATKQCPKCNAIIDATKRFCSECGFDTQPLQNATPTARCPHCGAECRQGSKFCPECGNSLIKTCPSCGVKIDGNPKFCPECGAKLG